MLPGENNQTAPYAALYFPLHIALLSVGENMMPMGNWTVISKNPFRFLIAMEAGNHSLILIKKYKEAALHFMPWGERERVIRAGYLSGRDVNKVEQLGFELEPAETLEHTRLVKGADHSFEMVMLKELKGLSREFVPFVMDVVAVHGEMSMIDRQPILFLSDKDFATLGEGWRYRSSQLGLEFD